ncbi:MAG: hypothetical protein ACKOF9_06080 [Burkholderiales bacterium]
MSNHDINPADPDKKYRLIESQREFEDALRQAFSMVAEQGCRELLISDADFANWPLGERAVVDLLAQWAMSHRKMTVLARNYDEVTRLHARWVQWRRQWAHVVDCRVADDADAQEIPTLLLAPGVVVVRLVAGETVRGSISTDLGDIERAREMVDAITQRSQEGFPASTLGL